VDDEKALREIDSQIVGLEAQKAALLTQGLPEEEPELDRREYPYSFGGGRGDDGSWER
jgi:hypothetical protein